MSSYSLRSGNSKTENKQEEDIKGKPKNDTVTDNVSPQSGQDNTQSGDSGNDILRDPDDSQQTVTTLDSGNKSGTDKPDSAGEAEEQENSLKPKEGDPTKNASVNKNTSATTAKPAAAVAEPPQNTTAETVEGAPGETGSENGESKGGDSEEAKDEDKNPQNIQQNNEAKKSDEVGRGVDKKDESAVEQAKNPASKKEGAGSGDKQGGAGIGEENGGDEKVQKPPARNTEWDWWLNFVGGYTPRQVIGVSFVIMLATQAVSAGVVLTLFGVFVGKNSPVFKWLELSEQQNDVNLEKVKEAFLQEFRDGKIQLPNQPDPNHLTVEQYKKQFEEDAKKLFEKEAEKLQDKYKTKLEEQSKNLTEIYEKKLEETNKTLTQKFQKELTSTIEKCDANIQGANSVMEGKLDSAKSEFLGKQNEFEERLSLEPQKMEIRGFMKIETFGPVLLAVALVEILLMLFVCNMCCSGKKNSNASQPQANGRIIQGRTDPVFKPIDTNNNNMAVLFFRDDDEKRCANWAKEIVESAALDRKPRIRTFVVNSVDDVQLIPACKAALVFVNPDEREMIIEDERHHIGQGLRRQAVQRLMDSGVEVFVMIFSDQGSDSLQGGQLYNKRLGQITEHRQLIKLKAERRIISIRNTIHAHQSQHIVDELKHIFT